MVCAAGMADEEAEDGMVQEVRGGIAYFWARHVAEDKGVEAGRREEEEPRYVTLYHELENGEGDHTGPGRAAGPVSRGVGC